MPGTEQLLTQLPDGVTVNVHRLGDLPQGSLQDSISSQPELHTGSGANPEGETSMIYSSIPADDNATLERSTTSSVSTNQGSFDFQFARAIIANQGQVTIPSVDMDANSGDISENYRDPDWPRPPEFQLDHNPLDHGEVPNYLPGSFLPADGIGRVSPFDFQLDPQFQGVLLSVKLSYFRKFEGS